MGLTENEQDTAPPGPCKKHGPGWLLQRTASLPGQPGSGFCPSAVISVISSHVEGLLENEKNGFSEGCKPSSKPANSPGFNLSVAIYLGIT